MVTEGTAQKITLYNVIKHYITLSNITYVMECMGGHTDLLTDRVTKYCKYMSCSMQLKNRKKGNVCTALVNSQK